MYSRRSFLKAAGAGTVTLTTGAGCLSAGTSAPQTTPQPPVPALAIPAAMTKEKTTLRVNRRSYPVEYEARTTLWEVIAVKLGLTGTNRSCNRASCGACSVLIDGDSGLLLPHAGDRGGRQEDLHGRGPWRREEPAPAAAGRLPLHGGGLRFLHGRDGKSRRRRCSTRTPIPPKTDVKDALAGHICRCAAYAASFARSSTPASCCEGRLKSYESESQSPKYKIVASRTMSDRHQPADGADFSTGGGHGPEDTLVEGDDKSSRRSGRATRRQNLNIIGKPLPPMPEVAIPRFTGQGRIRHPGEVSKHAAREGPRQSASAREDQAHGRFEGGEDAGRRLHPYVQNAPKTYPLPRGTVLPGRNRRHGRRRYRGSSPRTPSEAIEVEYEVLPFASTLRAGDGAECAGPSRRRGNLVAGDRRARYDPNVTVVSTAMSRRDSPKPTSSRSSRITSDGGIPVPIQPCGGVAKWDGDKLTFWGMGQGIYPQRRISRGGSASTRRRFVSSTSRTAARSAARSRGRFNPWIAHIAKDDGPARQVDAAEGPGARALQIKPREHREIQGGREEDGQDHRLPAHLSTMASGDGSSAAQGGGRSELYLHVDSNWKEIGLHLHAPTRLDRRLAQQHAAGVQVGLGTDDGRDGGSGRDGSRRVPAAERPETGHDAVARTGRHDRDPDAES